MGVLRRGNKLIVLSYSACESSSIALHIPFDGSSASLEHNGLLEPHRLGPGLAMLEYPDELRLLSEVVRSWRATIENGLR